MSLYTEFYLNSNSSVVKLDCIEITHPDFTKDYYIVRNAIAGVMVTLEDGVTDQEHDYYPLQITPTGSDTDLDQVLKVNVGDLGEVVPKEIDAVQVAGGMSIKPKMVYRQYRSDDLSGPFELENFQVDNIAKNNLGATMQASAPRLNILGTGQRMTYDRFPTLIGV